MRSGMRLRTRVIALGVGTATLVVVLAAVPIALLLRSNAEAAATQRATYAVQAAADYLSAGDPRLLGPYLDRLERRGDPPVTVIGPGGMLAGAPLRPDALHAAQQRASTVRGDHDHDNLGEVSAVYTSSYPHGRIVQAFGQSRTGVARVVAVISDASVGRTIRDRYLAVALAGLGLLALAWAAAEVTGRRLVRPLQRAADTAVSLSGGDMTARAPVEGPPEVARVAVELNALAARIDELLAQEREAAADLSHRLRTPLTAVRLAVENLAPGAERDELETYVATLERTLTHVIRTARRGLREGVHPRCEATAVVADRAAFWRPLAEDQERALVLDLAAGPLWVRASAEDLAAALDALIGNVVAHTPEGTGFAIVLGAAPYGADLDVLDEGAGIPVEAVTRGRSDRGSSGLGLDIARATAEATGGSLEVIESAGRRGVRMRLHAESQPGIAQPHLRSI